MKRLKKDFQGAERNYRKAMSLGYDKYAYLGMTKVHAMKDHLDKAMEILKMLVDKEPGDPRISAESRIFMEKYPQAGELYSRNQPSRQGMALSVYRIAWDFIVHLDIIRKGKKT